MNYLDRAEKVIRDEWFKDHVAEVRGEKGLQAIYWSRPETSMYSVKYVLSGSNIFISGDTGEAAYSLTCPATLEEIKDFDLGYFTGKLVAFCDERWDFDSDKARKELNEYWEEHQLGDHYQDSHEIYNSVLSAIDESINIKEYRTLIMTVYQTTSMHSDTLEYMWDFGERVPYRLIGYWVGLKMVIEQLLDGDQDETA
ncbi:hypothetical protein [Gracilibacillus alcaliphilus]|uniref:hypothetical protein n=1 Tax=Gracilibacillus alcaliphilus TaxID=1401441 RepID=UPI001958CD2E|nr:hypothetical protein [Gracilibacillus alcaliphilus]MBM7678952.1 hypothetical protein [Gracilibacillus alcaliphilus]